MFLGENIVDKTKVKKIFKSYIGLSSSHLTSNGWPDHQAGFIGVFQLSPQKDNTQFQKFFFSPFFFISRVEYVFSSDMYCLYYF